jgi:hypothetical protein
LPKTTEDFDAFKARRETFYELKKLPLTSVRSQFVLFRCSCSFFMKYAHCKHSMAIGIWTGAFKVPRQMSLAVIGEKGKRGRKRKAENVCYGAAKKKASK